MKLRIFITIVVASMGLSELHAATITVTSTNDTGPGSLRAAIASTVDGDTINCSVTARSS